MEFRRINGLPPYVFATINDLKAAARRDGRDVIDLGFGNPDLPSPDVAVEKLAEAARNPRNHRYSASRGIPKIRQAITDLYLRKFEVELDPDTEVVTTIGAKEGLSHLMWVLVGPGDTALVPSPSYPIHIYAPLFAGADVRHVRLDAPGAATGGSPGEAFFDNLMEAWESAWPKPRVIVLSFPHNPTTECVDLAWMTRLVDFAREHEIVLVHDFAYADIAFDGYTPPSILQVPGAKDVAVELYTMTKSFSMAGWRVGFLVGNADIVQALTKLKSYLDYGTFQPIQIAAIVAMNEAPDYPKVINEIYQARRDALCDGLNRIGWEITPPRGTMFVWAPIPEPYREMGSLEFCQVPGAGGRRGHLARRRVRSRRRRPRALRPHRERAAHRPGRAQPAQGPDPAALTADQPGRARPVRHATRPSGLRAGRRRRPRPGPARCVPTGWPLTTDSVLVGAVIMYRVRRSAPPNMQAKQVWEVATRSTIVATLGHEEALGGDGVGHPHPALGVEADAVGRAPGQGRPDPSAGQRPVVTDVEGGEPAGQCLGHDQGPAVGGDDRPVGEGHVLRGHVGRSVRVDADQRGGRRSGWLEPAPPRPAPR